MNEGICGFRFAICGLWTSQQPLEFGHRQPGVPKWNSILNSQFLILNSQLPLARTKSTTPRASCFVYYWSVPPVVARTPAQCRQIANRQSKTPNPPNP